MSEPVTNIQEKITTYYGGKIRIRVCGLLLREEQLLVLKHVGFGELGYIWLPPGGGVNFGESLTEALIREFKEETGLEIEVMERLFVVEFRKGNLHAIEFFYRVEMLYPQEAIVGIDPEFAPEEQLIQELQWMNIEELKRLGEKATHQVIEDCSSFAELFARQGKWMPKNLPSE